MDKKQVADILTRVLDGQEVEPEETLAIMAQAMEACTLREQLMTVMKQSANMALDFQQCLDELEENSFQILGQLCTLERYIDALEKATTKRHEQRHCHRVQD